MSVRRFTVGSNSTFEAQNGMYVLASDYDRASPLIQTHYVIEEINRLARGEAVICTGVGPHHKGASRWLRKRLTISTP